MEEIRLGTNVITDDRSKQPSKSTITSSYAYGVSRKENSFNLPMLESKKDEGTIQISRLQTRFDEFSAKLQSQQSQVILEKQNEIFRLKNQLLHQTKFCTSLAVILENLAWRASHYPEIVKVWLTSSQSELKKFLSIANGIFVSFINTYSGGFPSTTDDEYQFVLGLLGIVSNIAASPDGRQFLITCSVGKQLIGKFVKLFCNVPSPSGNVIKRLLLTILYNVSVNRTGLVYLFAMKVGDILKSCLADSSPIEIQLLCLRLLQSISYDMNDANNFRHLETSIPRDKIGKMTTKEDDNIATMARDICYNMEKSRQAFNIEISRK